MSDTVRTGGAPKPMGAYPHARRVGDLLFLSGMGPRSPETDEIPGLVLGKNGEIQEYDMAAQCHAVFANVRSVLEAAGLGWGDLVDVTVFLTDMDRDFATFNRIYAEYFSDNQPCRTTVEINRLPTPIAIELKCIATTGDHGEPA
ncbi:MAG: RidA family protein [Proteobacteria bacterium]|nr:RidA family protein [Pseudomonadota bacterium]